MFLGFVVIFNIEYTKGVILNLFDYVPGIFFMNTECKEMKVQANLIAERCPFPNTV